MFDAASYIMGKSAGGKTVEITGGVTCTDDGEGNITITEEVSNDG